MTTDERLAAIEDDYFHYEDRDDADVRWLIAEVRRLAGENVKLRTRLKEQTAATQEAHEFVDNEIRSHLEGFVELGDNSCPVWQRVRSAVARLTDEVRRLQGEYARGRADELDAIRTFAGIRWHVGDVSISAFMKAIERGEHVAEVDNG